MKNTQLHQPLNTDHNLIYLATLHVSIILRQQRERVGERCCTRPHHIIITHRAVESQNHEMHDCDQRKIADQINPGVLETNTENPSFPTGGDGGTSAESGEQSAAWNCVKEVWSGKRRTAGWRQRGHMTHGVFCRWFVTGTRGQLILSALDRPVRQHLSHARSLLLLLTAWLDYPTTTPVDPSSL